MALPSTLTASLASKLDRLGEPTRSVFDAIVVLGKHSSLARLEAIVQLPRHSLVTSLRVLEEGGLIRSTPSLVSCTHDLFAVAAHSQMPGSVPTIAAPVRRRTTWRRPTSRTRLSPGISLLTGKTPAILLGD